MTKTDKDKLFNLSLIINVTHDEAKIIEDLFDKDENPRFLITKKIVKPFGIDFTQLEIFIESTRDIWFLAKNVEHRQLTEKRRQEIIELLTIKREYEKLINKN